MAVDPHSIWNISMYTPQKSNIDTNNGHISNKSPFPNHSFGYPAVSFRGCIPSQYQWPPRLLLLSRGFRTKPSFATITGRGPRPTPNAKYKTSQTPRSYDTHYLECQSHIPTSKSMSTHAPKMVESKEQQPPGSFLGSLLWRDLRY